ncbi:MAG: hypothetical protein FWG36_10980 [Oscillospiraceae bacterium]|nr:hypothetical protein [Oscillospiraceae bacterium]
MADKKSNRRFTVQFNRTDPAHRQVADILNRLEWRGKAQYIVNAVLYYINRGERPAFDEKHIEAIVNRILHDKNYSGAGSLPVSAPAGSVEITPLSDSESVVEINFDEAMEALGEDGFSAVAGALDMFRKSNTPALIF